MAKLDLRSVSKLLGLFVLAWLPFAAGSVFVEFLRNRGGLSPGWWRTPCLLFALVNAPLVFSAVTSYAVAGAKELLPGLRRVTVVNGGVALGVATLLGAIVWLLTGDRDLAEGEVIAYLAMTALCLLGTALMVFVEHRRHSRR